MRWVPALTTRVSALGVMAIMASASLLAAPFITSITPFRTAAGGAAFTVTVNGTGFTTSSQIRWNGVSRATTYVSATRVTATVTAQEVATPDTYPVAVWNGSTGSNAASFVVYFLDVTPGHSAYDYVNLIRDHGISAGCGGNNYCPTSTLTRAQMAVFLLYAEHGPSYVPPACSGIFADVACPTGFAVNFIEQLYNEGITAGCQTNPLKYCPNNTITRQEMAVFLLKARYGISYSPPACQGIFQDVACSSQYARWIEDAYARDVFTFCAVSPLRFCPTNATTRAAMAEEMANNWNYTDVTLTLQATDPNFTLAGVGLGSVVYAPDVFSLYMTNAIRRFTWIGDSLGDTVTNQIIPGCDNHAATNTDDRCGDQIGLFWKHISCQYGGACGTNTHWNAWPGSDNIATYPVKPPAPMPWPPVPGFSHMFNANSLKAVLPAIPTGADATCHGENPDALPTAVSAPRVVWHPGRQQYLVAFNVNINHPNYAEPGPPYPWSGSDNWRVVWAVSSNGSDWDIYPGFVLRNVYEASDCGAGFQVLDLIVDGNYIYLLVQSPDSLVQGQPPRQTADHLYLLRSLVSTSNTYGFTTWELASNPLTATGEYTWTSIPTGDQVNLETNGYPIMNSGQHVNQQAAIAPVFASAAANTASRYIGVSSNGQPGQTLYCWSTSSLTKPFIHRTTVINAIGLPAGEYGWYLSFTHYPDNITATPRIIGPAFDLWLTGSDPTHCGTGGCRNITYRVTSKVGGYIYWP